MEILGIDIGGSAVKGAPVDLKRGRFAKPRHRIPTPQPATPKAVAKVVAEIVNYFNYEGAIGCALPSVVQNGVVLTAANVDDDWIGTNGRELFTEATGCPVEVLNDADAAGLVEMEFGAGRGENGVVILLTFGTGIGSAVFSNRQLVPNTEFGHLDMGGKEAEERASARVRKIEDLSWKKWSKRVDRYLRNIEDLFWPDLFILGGGISQRHEKFIHRLTTRTRVVPAQMFNDAGIIGSACMARSHCERSK